MTAVNPRPALSALLGAEETPEHPVLIGLEYGRFENTFIILRSSTSSLNSLGWFGSPLLSIGGESMRPVGTQSRFTTPTASLFPDPKLSMTDRALAIYSFRDAERDRLAREASPPPEPTRGLTPSFSGCFPLSECEKRY